MKYEDQIDHVLLLVEEYQWALSIAKSIDEISVFFKSEKAFDAFAEFAPNVGWEKFNTVEDTVYGDEQKFDVKYNFFKNPKASYRIEAMIITSGISLLHKDMGDWSIAHASYKARDMDDYNDQKANDVVKAELWNSYGRMFYIEDDCAPYLKCRVNTRDAQ